MRLWSIAIKAVISVVMGLLAWWVWAAATLSNTNWNYGAFLLVAASVFVFAGSGLAFGTIALLKREKRIAAVAGMLLDASSLILPVMLLTGITGLL